jgi:diguanylate cyclase (GGDEF)-like protein
VDPASLASSLDPSDARFWRRLLLLACASSVATCVFVGVYLALTWDRPHRPLLAVIVGASCAASLLLPALPTGRFMQGRPRDVFFFTWSVMLIGLITLLVDIDGGPTALAGLYFLPLIFATMAYPPGPMIGVGVATVGAFLAVMLLNGAAFADVLVLAGALATAATMCAWQSRLHGQQRSELARLSRADPLTGCLNRRGLQERVDGELARATREVGQLSLVLVDLDGFKAVNDHLGHAAGDELLRWTVARIGATIRPMDALGRQGGDEFAVLLPGASPSQAREVADRIHLALGERTGASTGTASFPVDGVDAEELHAVADSRLYEAKRGLQQGVEAVG